MQDGERKKFDKKIQVNCLKYKYKSNQIPFLLVILWHVFYINNFHHSHKRKKRGFVIFNN